VEHLEHGGILTVRRVGLGVPYRKFVAQTVAQCVAQLQAAIRYF
jgi:hypothetical protein